MRTNIEIEDALMRAALSRSGLPTKRAAVEAGLRLLVRLSAQQRVRALRGRLRWAGEGVRSRRR